MLTDDVVSKVEKCYFKGEKDSAKIVYETQLPLAEVREAIWAIEEHLQNVHFR